MAADSIVGREMIVRWSPQSLRADSESGANDRDWVLDSHMPTEQNDVVLGRLPERLRSERIR